jgi:uncharacterized protein DUF4386
VNLPDPRSLPRLVNGWSLVIGPLFLLASAIVSPPLKSTDAATIAEIARHPDRWYWFALFTTIGSILLVPALFGVMGLLRERTPWLANLGGGLAQLGVLVAIGDSMTQLLIWKMGSPGADPAQMAALAQRYDDAVGSTLPFTIGGLALLVGCVLLSIGVWRTRVAPRWAAVGLPVGAVLNIGGFSAASTALLIVSCVVLLVALAAIGRVVLERAAPARVRREAVPASR